MTSLSFDKDLIQRVEPREIKFETGINPYAHGSVMAYFGNTKVHITCVLDEAVPPWLKGKGKGWVTAEYSMLPSATHSRVKRERKGVSGRSQEIQRLIGRSLRSIIDLEKLGERQLLVDCDVMVADGGTRTTSISGGFVALRMAVDRMLKEGIITEDPIIDQLAALSLGITKEGKIIADLNYEEDSSCEADVNVVLTKKGHVSEFQATAEGEPFSLEQLTALTHAATQSMEYVFKAQDKILK